MCDYYRVPFLIYGNRESLGKTVGRQFRATVALTDQGLAGAIIKELKQNA